MPKYRADFVTLLILIFLVASAGWIAYSYGEARSEIIAERRHQLEMEARRQAAALVNANRRENIPVRRFIPPEPIVVPFY
jgi:phosphopantothenate synthetase